METLVRNLFNKVLVPTCGMRSWARPLPEKEAAAVALMVAQKELPQDEFEMLKDIVGAR